MINHSEIPIKIALVDDSALLRKFIGSYLSKQGFEIMYEAETGANFLEALDQSGMLPDLCLLDEHMPGLSGPETASRLKVHYPSIRIMAFSFFDETGRPDLMLQSGAHDFISKEAQANEIRDALRKLYERGNDLNADQ